MDIQKLTCTIADDSIFSRKILHNICQELNLSVVKEYASGDELLADLDTTSYPDLIFLDINMPGHSGTELIEILLDLNPDFIIIMISSISDLDEIKECLELGAANYVHKDAGISTMKEIIRSTIKNSGLS
ncbi:response regulator [Acetobacterium carbinolicum]|jgi:DNA-binding NarL/FixJ family response regulator|uniref:response regulator n=1 Tax=Acetobacterium TaxID=33951 RepID=UPI000DBEB561|nr:MULTISPECIES: response regulator [unclassified Acetobacterium]AWW25538.1 hypothetical protein DOZ58_02135 [Acetobacterium sp. KB-1]MDK2943194.1 hypothetical protein [Acetobacterium sp.]MDZ5724482.1 response regulator [Acetobacterium sp. K1/6]